MRTAVPCNEQGEDSEDERGAGCRRAFTDGPGVANGCRLSRGIAKDIRYLHAWFWRRFVAYQVLSIKCR